jgi:hypothetical protein
MAMPWRIKSEGRISLTLGATADETAKVACFGGVERDECAKCGGRKRARQGFEPGTLGLEGPRSDPFKTGAFSRILQRRSVIPSRLYCGAILGRILRLPLATLPERCVTLGEAVMEALNA